MQTLDQARSNGALGPKTLAVMGRLCGLFGMGLVEGGLADLLEAGWMTGKFAGMAFAQRVDLDLSWSLLVGSDRE